MEPSITEKATFESASVVETNEASVADARTLRVMTAAAAYHARKVARMMRLSDVDREDVEQDILLVLLERRRFFDPARGAWSSFSDYGLNVPTYDRRSIAVPISLEGWRLSRAVTPKPARRVHRQHG